MMIPSANAQTSDPPHVASQSVLCNSCHMTLHSPAASISNAMGNVNLCLSCHTPGGVASRYALVDSDQAVFGPSLPTNVIPYGTSHRWDSGLSGRAEYIGNARTNSSGQAYPAGDYTGRVAKTYVLSIATAGQVGTAKFDWYGTQPGGGGASNVTVAGSVALDQNVSVVFSNGTVNPSFRIGDRWNLYVRPDINLPTNPALLAVSSNGLLACSGCHDHHSQANTPFDTNAPALAGSSGRHFMRINNDADQLCVACHAARDVTNAAAGSHPTGIAIPVGAFYRIPAALPLEKGTGKVRCLTCHDVHNSASSDGSMLRISNRLELCTQCHLLADTNGSAHLTQASGVLWPGPQYGNTTYPAETDLSQRGMCNNCHQPHGWPTNLTAMVDFTNLLIASEESLCFTCHDGSPAASTNSVMNDFTNSAKVVRHPVSDSDPIRLLNPGFSVECTDCHNSHKARIGRSVYSATATATRNQVMGPLVGVPGVVFNYSSLTNFMVPSAGNFSLTNNATYEYQICFKCHSSYHWGTNTPPRGISANGVTNPVETDLAQEFSPMNRSGHPIVTGLDNYTNSAVVGGKRGLLAAALKAPWNTNVGQQTMLCTDCHNTDGTAAQGPHGSAVRYMLRGSNANNWPGGTSFSSSWCANCHNETMTFGHETHENAGACYACHIVIPHGGKMSRLIADRDGAMPARYAYNNTLTNVKITSFSKNTATGYGTGNCRTSCGGHSTGSSASMNNW